MHYDGPIFRPPLEAYTPLLQVTVGCSHNRCSFCSMYRSVGFSISPLSEVEEDILEIKAMYGPNAGRIYLLNGDPFVLSTEKLLEISELIYKHLPRVGTITCYCSVGDIRNKTADDLAALAAAGFDELWIGLESGYDPALKLMNKGYTKEEAEVELGKLRDAGITWNCILLMGAAGQGNYPANVAATADLLETCNPRSVAFMSMMVIPGTPLFDMREAGEYAGPTEREILEEELLFLKELKLPDNCEVWGGHTRNLVKVNGLFGDRAHMIKRLEEVLEHGDPRYLDTVPELDFSRM